MLRFTLAVALLCATPVHPTETRTIITKFHADTVVSDGLISRQSTPVIFRRIYAKVSSTPGAKINPVSFALAVMSTGTPRMLTAIAFRESHFNPRALGKDGDSGMFQVIAKHWGAVSTDPTQQARQAASILKALNYNVARYNGSGRAARRYAQRVMQTYREI